MESLRGHTSGFAVPTYVIDAPEGGGKVPLLPNYLLSMSDSRVVVRNYEGLIASYAQPAVYRPHDSKTCAYCLAETGQQDTLGVAGLLNGERHKIVPEGWTASHERIDPGRTAALEETDGELSSVGVATGIGHA
jgi:lysine 2,3-aminomutase